LRLLEAGIVDTVEEILQPAAHVAEVLRRADDDGGCLHHVFRPSLQSGNEAQIDARYLGRTGTLDHRIAQPLGVGRRRVSHDQQLFEICHRSHTS
jgi:hypothetical protein